MNPPSPNFGQPTPAAQTPNMSLAGRLMNIFAAPGEVFECIKAAPVSTVNWLAPALLFILVSWLGAALVLSQDSIKQQLRDLANKAVEQQIEKGKIPKEQQERVRQTAEQWGSIGTKISMVTWPVLAGLLSPFWWGLILWLGAKVLKTSCSYMKMVEVAGLTNMIAVLDSVVRTLLILSTGNLFAAPNLALFVKEFDQNNTLHAILGAISLMTLWALAVKSVGLARLCGASLGRAAMWVFGIWAAYTGFFIAIGAMMRAVFGR